MRKYPGGLITVVQNSAGSPSRKPPPDKYNLHGAPQRSHQTHKTIPIFLAPAVALHTCCGISTLRSTQ